MKPVTSRWNDALLVCGKCTKRVGGGFGPKRKTRLAKLRRSRLGKGRKAPLGVVETKCLDVCPRNGVVVVDTRRPGEWRIVTPGSEVDDLTAQPCVPAEVRTQPGLLPSREHN